MFAIVGVIYKKQSFINKKKEKPLKVPISDAESWFWQYPAFEQKGAQQGQLRLELQLPAPLPTSTLSSSEHAFPFHDLHVPVMGLRVWLEGPQNIWKKISDEMEF